MCAIYLVLLAVAGLGRTVHGQPDRYRIELNSMRAVSEPHTWSDLAAVHRHFHQVLFRIRSGAARSTSSLQPGQSTARASLHAAQIAFLGPLLGCCPGVYGGKLADRISGSRVTLAAFCAMLLATGILISASTFGDHLAGPMQTATMVGYVIGFTAVHLSGIGVALCTR